MYLNTNPIEQSVFNQTLLVDVFGQSFIFLPRQLNHSPKLGELVTQRIDIHWAQSLLKNHSSIWGHQFDLNKLYFQLSGDCMTHHKSEQQKIAWLSNAMISGEIKVLKGNNFAPMPPTSATGAIPIAATSASQASKAQTAPRSEETSLGRGGYTDGVPAAIYAEDSLCTAPNTEPYPNLASAGLNPQTVTDITPECHRTAFSISCGHSKRGYEFDVLNPQADNPKMRFAVVGKDSITVKQQGSCANGSSICPSINVTGPDISVTKKASNFKFSVNAPSSSGRKVANLKDFIGSISNGYDSYQSYQLKAQGCSSGQPSAEVHAYDPYQWDGRLTLGYVKQWEVTSSLKGKMGASEWSLETASANNSFSNFLNQLNSIIQQVKSLVGQAENGHGYEIFKSGFSAPKLSIGGGLKLAEREASPDVGLQGNLDLKFEPLIGFSFSCDVITAVIKRVFPGKLADPILEARKATKEGVKLGNGKVKASANVEIELSMDGRVDSLLGWEFKPDGRCLPTQGADASKVEAGIGISLKAVTDAKVEVFIISVQIGSEIKAEGAEGAQGVGLLFSAYATEINNQPSMAGKAVFSGMKLVYSYHAKVMAKGSESNAHKVAKTRGGKRGGNFCTEKKVSGEKVLLEPITIFDTGRSKQGATLDNVHL